VIESSVDGLLVIDPEGVVRFANPASAGLFADKTDQLVGFHLGVPASHEPVDLVLPRGGSVMHVEMRSTDIIWQGNVATLANLRDITDRIRADQTMQRQAEELRQRNEELMNLNRAFVGRELRMIELKQEVNDLCLRLNEAPRHRIPFVDAAPGNRQF
jgi:hypothetical protein